MGKLKLPSFCKYSEKSVVEEMERKINADEYYNPCAGTDCIYDKICIAHVNYEEPVPERQTEKLEAWRKAMRERDSSWGFCSTPSY